MKIKKKIGLVYSSFNNYSMLEKEVLNRVHFNNFPVINIDDHSSVEEQKKGKEICERENIIFQVNKKKGVQHALNQGIEYLKENFDCEWVFCLQQDIFTSDKNFFYEFEKYINQYETDKIGAIGFNCIEKGQNHYTKNSYKKFIKKGYADGFLGVFFLSDTKKLINKISFFWYGVVNILLLLGPKKYKDKVRKYIMSKRVFCENHFYDFNKTKKLFTGLFSI